MRRSGDLTDEMIAKKIVELAKAGERNVEVLCEAALNVPAGAVSASNFLRCRIKRVPVSCLAISRSPQSTNLAF